MEHLRKTVINGDGFESVYCDGCLDDWPCKPSLILALAATKEALADSHESLTDMSDATGDACVFLHSAIAFCTCGTATAYRAAKAALKGVL